MKQISVKRTKKTEKNPRWNGFTKIIFKICFTFRYKLRNPGLVSQVPHWTERITKSEKRDIKRSLTTRITAL